MIAKHKKQEEQNRRDVVDRAPINEELTASGGGNYGEILEVVWKAWDRSGHAGAPSGEEPKAFLVTAQRGKTGVRMLWYLGVDGLWRDCARIKQRTKTVEQRVTEACRDAIQPYLDEFAAKEGRVYATKTHVDHAVIPFSKILQGWIETLSSDEVSQLSSAVGSKSGVLLEEAINRGRGGEGGATGKSQFLDTFQARRLRTSWYSYHAEKAVLQLLEARENMSLGARPHAVSVFTI